jgi:hypothetical protein
MALIIHDVADDYEGGMVYRPRRVFQDPTKHAGNYYDKHQQL